MKNVCVSEITTLFVRWKTSITHNGYPGIFCSQSSPLYLYSKAITVYHYQSNFSFLMCCINRIILLFLTLLAQNSAFNIHLCFCVYQFFFSFKGCVVIHCLDVPGLLIHLLINICVVSSLG